MWKLLAAIAALSLGIIGCDNQRTQANASVQSPIPEVILEREIYQNLVQVVPATTRGALPTVSVNGKIYQIPNLLSALQDPVTEASHSPEQTLLELLEHRALAIPHDSQEISGLYAAARECLKDKQAARQLVDSYTEVATLNPCACQYAVLGLLRCCSDDLQGQRNMWQQLTLSPGEEIAYGAPKPKGVRHAEEISPYLHFSLADTYLRGPDLNVGLALSQINQGVEAWKSTITLPDKIFLVQALLTLSLGDVDTGSELVQRHFGTGYYRSERLEKELLSSVQERHRFDAFPNHVMLDFERTTYDIELQIRESLTYQTLKPIRQIGLRMRTPNLSAFETSSSFRWRKSDPVGLPDSMRLLEANQPLSDGVLVIAHPEDGGIIKPDQRGDVAVGFIGRAISPATFLPGTEGTLLLRWQFSRRPQSDGARKSNRQQVCRFTLTLPPDVYPSHCIGLPSTELVNHRTTIADGKQQLVADVRSSSSGSGWYELRIDYLSRSLVTSNLSLLAICLVIINAVVIMLALETVRHLWRSDHLSAVKLGWNDAPGKAANLTGWIILTAAVSAWLTHMTVTGSAAIAKGLRLTNSASRLSVIAIVAVLLLQALVSWSVLRVRHYGMENRSWILNAYRCRVLMSAGLFFHLSGLAVTICYPLSDGSDWYNDPPYRGLVVILVICFIATAIALSMILRTIRALTLIIGLASLVFLSWMLANPEPVPFYSPMLHPPSLSFERLLFVWAAFAVIWCPCEFFSVVAEWLRKQSGFFIESRLPVLANLAETTTLSVMMITFLVTTLLVSAKVLVLSSGR